MNKKVKHLINFQCRRAMSYETMSTFFVTKMKDGRYHSAEGPAVWVEHFSPAWYIGGSSHYTNQEFIRGAKAYKLFRDKKVIEIK